MAVDDIVIEDAFANVIFPPAEKKKQIDKAAEYVVKHGEPFVMKMLQKDPKRFDYLVEGHAFHAYYKLKVSKLKEGVTDELVPAVPKAVIDIQRHEEEKEKKKQQTLMITDGGASDDIRPPASDVFTIPYPIAAHLDIEIIKITAQFTALNGEPFLVGLSQREASNPIFDFIKPTSSLHNFFCQAVDAYKKSILPPSDTATTLKDLSAGVDIKAVLREQDMNYLMETQPANRGDGGQTERYLTTGQQRFLDRCKNRYLYDTKVTNAAEVKAKVAQLQQQTLAAIDWTGGFVVVETIQFDDADKVGDLPPPRDFSAFKAARENRANLLLSRAVEEEHLRERANMVEASRAAREVLRESKETVTTYVDGIPVVANYERSGVKRAEGAGLVACPVTGQMVRADDMSNHLRIVLLDPKWKEQKEKVLARAATMGANFANDADIAANLSRFMQKRPDVFGGDMEAKLRAEMEEGSGTKRQRLIEEDGRN